MTDAFPAWRITRGCRLYRRVWGDEFLVYNAGSGDTHLLDSLSAKVLEALEESSLSTSQLAELLRVKAGSGSEQDLSFHLSGLLPKLHDLGLIESLPQ